MPAAKVPQRVTLLHSGGRLGVEPLALLGLKPAVRVIGTPLELARGGPPADVVVVDVPAEHRRAVCEQVRHHHRGRLIVLLDPGDNSHDLPPDRNRTLLMRPFSMHDLVDALAASAPVPPAADPAGRRLPPSDGAQDRGIDPHPGKARGTVAQAVLRPVRSWRDRRLVRVSAILAAAALAFMAAFGLVSQGDRCPPRCDELTGAGDLPTTSGTTVQAVGVGPETVDSGPGVSGPTTTNPGSGPTAAGGSRTDVATGGSSRSSTSTSRSSGAPGSTSPPDPTRPPPSVSSTTAPTTTRPAPTTTTTAPTTTTTAVAGAPPTGDS